MLKKCSELEFLTKNRRKLTWVFNLKLHGMVFGVFNFISTNKQIVRSVRDKRKLKVITDLACRVVSLVKYLMLASLYVVVWVRIWSDNNKIG